MFAMIDNLIEEIVSHCSLRRPEALDKIFDNLPSSEYQYITLELLEKISVFLQNDTDSLAWFCGYMASEINCSEDSHQPNLQLPLYQKSSSFQVCSHS
ncbi:MAG: hypothetical protein PUP92_07550 [Rhizonema sp. PD38]|nr:hypothetical protein [Rhizonema sp. PD38]